MQLFWPKEPQKVEAGFPTMQGAKLSLYSKFFPGLCFLLHLTQDHPTGTHGPSPDLVC